MLKKRKTNLEKIREQFKKTGGGGGSDKFFKVKAPARGEETVAKIRICPGGPELISDGVQFFYNTAGLHYQFSQGGRNIAPPCPETAPPDSEHKFSCPICKFSARLKGSNNKKLKALGDNIRQSRQYWLNVVDRSDGKIKMYGSNMKFINFILDSSSEDGDIFDPESGADITIRRTGSTMMTTRYSYTVSRKVTPIGVKNYKKKMHNLVEMIEWRTVDELKELLNDNFYEEMKEVGMSYAPVKKKKKKVVEVEDEDTDDDEDVEDNDEEEVAESDEEDDEESEEEESESDEDDED